MIRESEKFPLLVSSGGVGTLAWRPFESLKGCCGMYGCILHMYVPNVY